MIGTWTGARWSFKTGDKWADAASLTPPLFSRDGSVLATRAAKGGAWYVLTSAGKKESAAPKGGEVSIDALALDARNKRCAYVARNEPGPAGRSWLVCEGERWDDFERAGAPIFSPDGKHVVFRFAQGKESGLAVDGERGPAGEWTFVQTPVFSSDGRRMAFVKNEGGTLDPWYRLVAGGEEHHEGGQDTLRACALGARESPAVGPPALSIRSPTFSPDGSRLACRVREADGWHVRVGEQKSAAHDEIGTLRFSRDGKKLAFGARSGRELWWRVLELE